MQNILPNDVTVRSCTAEDIKSIADYISNCSEDFLRSFGADKKKVPPKEVLMENLRKKLDENGVVNSFIIVSYKGQRIGHCNVNNIIENESGIFHGQNWDSFNRGKGIGFISVIKACDHFFNILNFNKIIFKVPQINNSANRVMQKLGFSNLGVVIYEFNMMIEPISCNLYEVDKKTIDELKNKLLFL